MIDTRIHTGTCLGHCHSNVRNYYSCAINPEEFYEGYEDLRYASTAAHGFRTLKNLFICAIELVPELFSIAAEKVGELYQIYQNSLPEFPPKHLDSQTQFQHKYQVI